MIASLPSRVRKRRLHMESLQQPYLFDILLMLQGKYTQGHTTNKLVQLLCDYMDYWLPLLLFVTLPLWVLPALLYYTAWRTLNLIKRFLQIGSKLINHEELPELSYAILKGNGRYLRDQSPDVHKKQFYDYTSRRFMTIGQFHPESKIIELQCDSTIGLQFFAEEVGSGTVVGVQSSPEVLRSVSNQMGLIVGTDYSLSGSPVGYDCLLLFNFKSKVKASGSRHDLITILAYCRHHMDQEGYLVFGDFFQEGELPTFLAIFEAFKFRVAEQEQITKNIEYARKLANKKNISFEQQILDTISKRLQGLFGKRNNNLRKEFIVLILQKM